MLTRSDLRQLDVPDVDQKVPRKEPESQSSGRRPSRSLEGGREEGGEGEGKGRGFPCVASLSMLATG